MYCLMVDTIQHTHITVTEVIGEDVIGEDVVGVVGFECKYLYNNLYLVYIMNVITTNIIAHSLPAPVAVKVEIAVSELVLNSHVEIIVAYFNSNGNIIDNKYIKIQGEEYNNWGLDDGYLVDLALSKLGLTKSA